MNLNKAIICGRLGKDPEMRYTPSGTAVANFSVAVTKYVRKKDEEGYDPYTNWIDVTAWGNTAERVAEYAKSGTEVIVEGSLDTRSWEDKNHPDVKHYRMFINAVNVQMGQGRRASDSAAPSAPEDSAKAQKPSESSDAPASSAPDAPPAPPAEDDDLPF
jgi:single-strand DNA-binding protein